MINRINDDDAALNVYVATKGVERYVFMFSDENRRALLQVAGRYAADPLLSFTWHDAAVLSQHLREQSEP